MLRNHFLSSLIAILAIGAGLSATGQGAKPSVVSGEVASISDTGIVITSASGAVNAVIAATTAFKRVSPDNPSITVASSMSEIAVGDKVTVTGVLSADGKTVPARSVYLMTKSDLSQKKAKDTDAWRTKGISGKVSSVNAQTNQIVVESGGFMAKTSVTLTPKAGAKMLRYAPDSVKFADAKPSTIADIKAGDEIRALGDKSSDGTAFSADTVLTGGFRQSAGKVKSIDAANKTVVVEDLATKKEVTIAFGDAVMMKRFPEEMATRMAAMQSGGGPVGGQGGVQVIRPAGGGQTPPAGGQRPLGAGRPNLGEMIDRLPNISGDEIKVGETIAVLTSSTMAGTDHVKAIKLVAGVDPFIKMAQAAAAAGGNRGGGGRGVDFNIPGLDSSFP